GHVAEADNLGAKGTGRAEGGNQGQQTAASCHGVLPESLTGVLPEGRRRRHRGRDGSARGEHGARLTAAGRGRWTTGRGTTGRGTTRRRHVADGRWRYALLVVTAAAHADDGQRQAGQTHSQIHGCLLAKHVNSIFSFNSSFLAFGEQ